jgi:antirestriction protein ArdC
MAKFDAYQAITDRILEQLKAGVVPWRQPWSGKAGGSYPRNAITGRAYSGVNVVLLWSEAAKRSYPLPLWLTYKQAVGAGGHVRAGAKATQVCFLSSFNVKDDASPTGERRMSFLRLYNVFNVAQCDGLPAKLTTIGEAAPRNVGSRDETADAFLATTKAIVVHGGSRAAYAPLSDHIAMPEFETFKSPDTYYSTLFHELTHWTGAKKRLDRTFGRHFGDETYSAEELVAELGAAFLCSEFSFDSEAHNAAYMRRKIFVERVATFDEGT